MLPSCRQIIHSHSRLRQVLVLLSCVLSSSVLAENCPNPPKGSAQARIELTPRGVQNAVNWGIKQGLLITSFELPKKTLPDGKDIPIVKLPLAGSYVADLTHQQIKSVHFGKLKVSCDSSLTCDVDLPITQLLYQADLDMHKVQKSKNLIEVDGLRAYISNNKYGEFPSIHFRAKINPNGTSKDWLQILDDHQEVHLPEGTYSLTRTPSSPAPQGWLSKNAYALSQEVVNNLQPSNLIGNLLKSDVLPVVVDFARPFLQAGIPVLHDDLTQDVPLFRVQDTIDLNQIDGHATDQQLAAKALEQTLKDPKLNSVAKVKTLLKKLPTDFPQILEAFRHIRNEDEAAPEFDRLKKTWIPVQELLNEKLKELGANPSAISTLMMPLDTYISGLESAQSNVHATAEKEKETFAIRAAAISIDSPSHSLEVAMSICVYCTPDPIQAVPLSSFPKFKAKKDYDSAFQVHLSALNSIVKQYYDNDAFDICVSEKTLQNCAFAPENEKKVKVRLITSPQLKMDKEGLYIELGGFESSGVAYGILNQLSGAKIRVDVGTDEKKTKLVLGLKSPELSFKADPSSWQTQISKGIVKSFDSAAQQALPQQALPQQALPMIQQELNTHWGEYMKPFSPSFVSQGVTIKDVQVGDGAITTYQDTAIADLNPAKIFADQTATVPAADASKVGVKTP